MKVSELIEQLQQLDQDSLVVVDGYEDGVNDMNTVSPVAIYLNVNNKSYYGKHAIVTDRISREHPKSVSVKAVYLSYEI